MKNNQLDVSKSSTKEKTAIKKADSKKAAKSARTAKANKMGKFFKDLKAEMKKIVWPTKKQVINNTGVVLVAMLISGLFIWGIDGALKLMFDFILKR